MLATRLPLTGAALAEPIDFARPGMPSLDTVHGVTAFSPLPGGPTYQILRTIEFDAYESSPATETVSQMLKQGPFLPTAIAKALQAAARPLSDNFAGTARKAAKLSIGNGQIEPFADVSTLIGTLPDDDAMVDHVPPITTGSTSARVAEEQRNVQVVGFLYAASREADNDFHLIVGRDPVAPPEMYMTMEVSGLPPRTRVTFQRLKTARDAFKAFFGAHLPPLSYDFYHPPIPVVVEGALFFDMSHATGQAPGPASLKSRMPTIWEVHPVTAIALGTSG